ncbi:extradiol dioxygenase [Thermogymnomonas acidicola]|uniref:Extradiol dioxygenase n=1 Tax=Thermogymnomonas acidicola TaxID=399579 RepID=A0AA37BSE7_9ARCH|nr:hypothetical protein [Thermogymnomonas acidicola]GGM78104.1 extradiol dioxygenase [Thermogymnomonas acidicola]
MISAVHVVPHGDELIDLPDANARAMSSHVARVLARDSAGTALVMSPHSFRLSGRIGVSLNERATGSYSTGRRRIRMSRRIDTGLARSISGLPDACSITFMTERGEKSIFPLDFGSMIPLRFMPARKIVVLTQARDLPRESLVMFGQNMGRLLDGADGAYSVIFSADQAHTHAADGPYGYSPEASIYEEAVRRAFISGDLAHLLDIDEETVQGAKPDSYWELLVLHGLLKELGLRIHYIYGYVAHYFGMMLASTAVEQ